MRTVRFVEPFGLVFLYWYVHWLVSTVMARRVELMLDGTDTDLCNYLKRMHLEETLSPLGEITIYPVNDLHLREADLQGRLLELRTLECDDDVQVEEAATSSLRVILKQQPELQPLHEELESALVDAEGLRVHLPFTAASAAKRASPRGADPRDVRTAPGFPAAQHRLTYPVWAITSRQSFEELRLRRVPSTMLIDSSGVILEMAQGELLLGDTGPLVDRMRSRIAVNPAVEK